jgi:hypothetical protein
MKSAYELAMERLAKTEPTRTLTAAQKTELAEINTRYQAKIAERETFLKGLIAQAQLKSDHAEANDLHQQLGRDVTTLKEEWDAKRDAVWKK